MNETTKKTKKLKKVISREDNNEIPDTANQTRNKLKRKLKSEERNSDKKVFRDKSGERPEMPDTQLKELAVKGLEKAKVLLIRLPEIPVERQGMPEEMEMESHISVQRQKLTDNLCWTCHKAIPSEDTEIFCCPDCRKRYHKKCVKKVKPNKQICECHYYFHDGINDGIDEDPLESEQVKLLLNLVMDRVLVDPHDKKNKDFRFQSLRRWPYLTVNPELPEIIDITILLSKIMKEQYADTNQFYQDVKRLLHNSLIVKMESKFIADVRKFEREIRLQLFEAEACYYCYQLEDDKPCNQAFNKLCITPHLIVWAKLKGYPYWPAKCLRIRNRQGDVRFFGSQNRALVPLHKICHISKVNPDGKEENKEGDSSYDKALKDFKVYVQDYEFCIGPFPYFEEKTPVHPLTRCKNSFDYLRNQAQESQEALDIKPDVSSIKESFQWSKTSKVLRVDISDSFFNIKDMKKYIRNYEMTLSNVKCDIPSTSLSKEIPSTSLYVRRCKESTAETVMKKRPRTESCNHASKQNKQSSIFLNSKTKVPSGSQARHKESPALPSKVTPVVKIASPATLRKVPCEKPVEKESPVPSTSRCPSESNNDSEIQFSYEDFERTKKVLQMAATSRKTLPLMESDVKFREGIHSMFNKMGMYRPDFKRNFKEFQVRSVVCFLRALLYARQDSPKNPYKEVVNVYDRIVMKCRRLQGIRRVYKEKKETAKVQVLQPQTEDKIIQLKESKDQLKKLDDDLKMFLKKKEEGVQKLKKLDLSSKEKKDPNFKTNGCQTDLLEDEHSTEIVDLNVNTDDDFDITLAFQTFNDIGCQTDLEDEHSKEIVEDLNMNSDDAFDKTLAFQTLNDIGCQTDLEDEHSKEIVEDLNMNTDDDFDITLSDEMANPKNKERLAFQTHNDIGCQTDLEEEHSSETENLIVNSDDDFDIKLPDDEIQILQNKEMPAIQSFIKRSVNDISNQTDILQVEHPTEAVDPIMNSNDDFDIKLSDEMVNFEGEHSKETVDLSMNPHNFFDIILPDEMLALCDHDFLQNDEEPEDFENFKDYLPLDFHGSDYDLFPALNDNVLEFSES